MILPNSDYESRKMDNNPLKGAIFDLDGVLVDTRDYHHQSWVQLGVEQGFELTETDFLESFGKQNAEVLPEFMGRSLTNQEIETLSYRKEEIYRELIAGKLQLLDGVWDLLSNLKENGYATAIGTSTTRENLDFMLGNTDVDQFFDDYVTSADITHGKPAPDTFLKAAEKLNLKPPQCVVIEDAIVGVQAGKSGGMMVLAVTNTRSAEELQQADKIVDSLTKVSSIDFDHLLALETT